jgi:hypothetical protein
MQLPKVIAGAIAVGIASSAHAAFTGWTVESRGNIGGVNVYQVFANFDDPNNFVLNCLKHRVTSGNMAGVVHNDPLSASGGSWNPALTITADQVANDSFVTMTGMTGAAAFTSLDPAFGGATGSTIPPNAGWYTTGVVGGFLGHLVGPTLRVMMMQVALNPDAAGYTAILEIGYKLAPSSTAPLFGNGTYTIPAPGALGLLLVAGMGTRRRRD